MRGIQRNRIFCAFGRHRGWPSGIVQNENGGRHKASPWAGEKGFRQEVHEHGTKQQMKEHCKPECPLRRDEPEQKAERIKNGGFKMSPVRHSRVDVGIPKRERVWVWISVNRNCFIPR